MFQAKGSLLMIHLPEELDHISCDYIRKEIERITSRIYVKTIQFDFMDTIFMDSSGIGLIMGRYRALGMKKDAIVGINVGKQIDRILHMAGIHKYMKILLKPQDVNEGEGKI